LIEYSAVPTHKGTVDLHALHRYAPERYPFLLQSTATTPSLGRYDILFAFPGEALLLEESGQLVGPYSDGQDQFLQALDAWWDVERVAQVAAEVPFSGGWFLYLSYELAGEVEPALRLQADTVMPIAMAVRCPAAVIVDHEDGVCSIVAEDSAAGHRDQIAKDIKACRRDGAPHNNKPSNPLGTSEEEPALFLEAVERAQDFIAQGDIYQANLSRRWSGIAADGVDADRIYAALRATNPAPFAGLVNWQDATIISSSPERLLKVRDGIASTRPIAGTRPRSTSTDIDNSLSAELFAHPKERAEHIMLIDLERNDLGRVCEPGSVEVDEMMVLESYAHVHHIVSNVRGKLRARVKPGDAIRAVFPGGTITGCPKVRCMQIISELENGARGAYTGSFGYLNLDGSLDLNILIRTIVMRANEVSFRAGSGIVADSEAQAELAETRAKAKGLLQALSL
jgi:anthranilate synthase component 1